MRRRAKGERDWVIEVPHRRGCAAVDRERPIDYGTVTGNLKAKTRRHARWLRFECNDLQCPARLLVNEDRIFEVLGARR